MSRKVKTADGPVIDFESVVPLTGAERWLNFQQDRSGLPVIRPTITVSAAHAYAAGEVVGGVLDIPNVMIENGRPATLTSLVVKEKGGLTPALRLLFFRAAPSGGTYADAGAFVWGTNDLANLAAHVDVMPEQFAVLAGKSWASLGAPGQDHDATATGLKVVVTPQPGTTYTPTSTDALMAEFHYSRK